MEITDAMRKTTVDVLEDPMDDLANQYEAEADVESAEFESYPGFMPFTQGGAEGRAFVYIQYLEGTGYLSNLPLKTQEALDRILGESYEEATNEYIADKKDILEKYGYDPQDYNDLYDIFEEIGYDNKELGSIDDFDMNYRDPWIEDFAVMLHMQIFLYDPDNYRNPFKGKLGCVVQASVNWESPYFRYKHKGTWEDLYAKQFSFTNNADLRKKLTKYVAEARNSFDK